MAGVNRGLGVAGTATRPARSCWNVTWGTRRTLPASRDDRQLRGVPGPGRRPPLHHDPTRGTVRRAEREPRRSSDRLPRVRARSWRSRRNAQSPPGSHQLSLPWSPSP